MSEKESKRNKKRIRRSESDKVLKNQGSKEGYFMSWRSIKAVNLRQKKLKKITYSWKLTIQTI